jgi:hypothetical protein
MISINDCNMEMALHVYSPVEGTGEDEVVVGRELAQAGLELALVDQTTSLVDDDKREDSPMEAVCQSRNLRMHRKMDEHSEGRRCLGSRQRGQ